MADTYYSRILRLKPIILADSALVETITATFGHVYDGRPIPPSASFLGFGDMHQVFNVGEINNPLNNSKLSVALRLSYWSGLDYQPYKMPRHSDLLAEQLARFEMAFNEGKTPPPYFAGIVSVPRLDGDRGLGFLVEDLSSNKNFPLRKAGAETVTRTIDGAEKTFLIDPLTLSFQRKGRGVKYLTKDSMVVIN